VSLNSLFIGHHSISLDMSTDESHSIGSLVVLIGYLVSREN